MSDPAAVLLRYTPAPADLDAIPQLVDSIMAAYPLLFERADANRALDGAHLYIYFWSHKPALLTDAVEQGMRETAQRTLPAGQGVVDALRLSPVLDLPGVSSGEQAGYHYVVETDVKPDVADDLNNWYSQEHLPGLASVPGNVRARRLDTTNSDGSVRSLACYDLITPATTVSSPWLAVRATPWASRVRPHFRNTRRVMCERLYLREAETATI